MPGILNPRILAAAEPGVIQTPHTTRTRRRSSRSTRGRPATTPSPRCRTWPRSPSCRQATGAGALGTFIDDDGVVASVAPFVATSVGSPGPVVGGLLTWLDIQPAAAAVGAAEQRPAADDAARAASWGQEKEVTDITARRRTASSPGHTNFTDWYYPSAGAERDQRRAAAAPGLAGTCTVGNVGAACSGATQAAADATCSQGINLDSTALSVGRGRRDIENLTQAATSRSR